MHGLTLLKEGLPFARDLSLQNYLVSYLCFLIVLLHSVSYFFFLSWSPSYSLRTVFDSISSNIDEVLSINPFLMCLPLDVLTPIIRTGSSMELIDLVNSVIIFLWQMTLHRWLTFLLGSLFVTLTSCPFAFIYFFWRWYLFYNGFTSIRKFLIMLLP